VLHDPGRLLASPDWRPHATHARRSETCPPANGDDPARCGGALPRAILAAERQRAVQRFNGGEETGAGGAVAGTDATAVTKSRVSPPERVTHTLSFAKMVKSTNFRECVLLEGTIGSMSGLPTSTE
jgi:hypothetical protein